MRATPPAPPADGRTHPARLVPDLLGALTYTVHELPHLVQDLRELVNELTRAAQPGGELMGLLDGLAELAYARAERERAEAAMSAASAVVI